MSFNITEAQLGMLAEYLAVENGVEEDDFRRAYSGRAMYGSTCLALVFDDPTIEYSAILGMAILKVVIESGDEPDFLVDAHIQVGDLTEAMSWVTRTARTDSMGRGRVIYWPGVAVTEE